MQWESSFKTKTYLQKAEACPRYPWDNCHDYQDLDFEKNVCLLWDIKMQRCFGIEAVWVSLVAQMVKNLPATWETWVWSLGFRRSSREGNHNPLQYSCPENPMDRGAWQATVHRVAKSSHNWVADTFTQKPLTSSQDKFGTTVSIRGNRQTYFSIDTKIFVWIAFLSENHRLYSCSSFILLGTRRWVKEPLPAEAPSQGSSLQTIPSCPKAEEGWGLVSRAFLEIITWKSFLIPGNHHHPPACPDIPAGKFFSRHQCFSGCKMHAIPLQILLKYGFWFCKPENLHS